MAIFEPIYRRKHNIFLKIGLLRLVKRTSKNICFIIFSFTKYFASKVAYTLLNITAIKKICDHTLSEKNFFLEIKKDILKKCKKRKFLNSERNYWKNCF